MVNNPRGWLGPTAGWAGARYLGGDWLERGIEIGAGARVRWVERVLPTVKVQPVHEIVPGLGFCGCSDQKGMIANSERPGGFFHGFRVTQLRGTDELPAIALRCQQGGVRTGVTAWSIDVRDRGEARASPAQHSAELALKRAESHPQPEGGREPVPPG